MRERIKIMDPIVFETDFPKLNLLKRGKIRDIYDLGDALLMVATDRISAFDVIMPDPVPQKGKILTKLSLFWFDIILARGPPVSAPFSARQPVWFF